MSERGQPCPRDLLNLPYFYTNFRSSEQVKQFLYRHRNRPGSYILRPSFSKPNCVSVSVVLSTGDIRHLNIHLDTAQSEYYLVPECKFLNIPALLEYYRVNPVHNEEQVTNVRFLNPVKRHARHNTDPALTTSNYMSLVMSEGQSSSQMNGSSRNRSGSDFGIQTQGHSPQRILSTRSEGRIQPDRGRSERMTRSGSLPDNPSRRSPHDKLPTVPNVAPGNVLSHRPPAALPNGHIHEFGTEYSQPRASDVDMSHRLQATLRENEISGICDCGLPTKESQLPEGWSVHQTAVNSSNRLFYQSPESRTFWVLPEQIASQLTEEHKENIKKLEEICKAATPIEEEKA
ncbi:uncharacterized protein LOC135470410 [Liolophura sinensis]|uniref:uncharacterized protein LOC135470410 n=1 Tax=Liolophura sinensis TaxID=3198878 RepID=UPI0031582D0C